MGTCVRCQVNFTNWVEYHNHKTTNTCYRKILPIRTSNKSKAQIIKELETKLGDINFIGFTKMEAPQTRQVEDAYATFMKNMREGII